VKRPPIYYADFVHTPMPRRSGAFRWAWTITDGMAGRTLASGTTLTRAGALRARIRVEVRCEQRAPYTQQPQHMLTRQEIGWINAVLDVAGIPVEVELCGTAVVVTPRRELTTEQEVRALSEVLDRTDAPVRWAGMA
jgi:hypothetical protein